MLKTPAVDGLMLTCVFKSTSVILIKLGTLEFGYIYMLDTNVFLDNCSLNWNEVSLFSSD